MCDCKIRILFFLMLSSMFGESVSATISLQEYDVYSEQEYNELESVPISSSIGNDFSQMAKNGTELDDRIIRDLFLRIDARNESDPAYVLLNMAMDKIDNNTGLLLDSKRYKGSGTVLYSSGDNVLLLTAPKELHSNPLIS